MSRKVCVVGDFAVGKTSSVERFVNNHFSDRYLTTVGVKIDSREIELASVGVTVKLMLWDVAGSSEFGEREMAYLRGASGVLFVVDGTRPVTMQSARNLRKQIEKRYGERPRLLLLNKSDLQSGWQVSASDQEALTTEFGEVFVTSAKTGAEVETALQRLAELVIADDLSLAK